MMNNSNTNLAENWRKFYRKNTYYHKDLQKISKILIPTYAKFVEFSSRGGELLTKLPNKDKIGVEFNAKLIKLAKNQNKKINIINAQVFWKKYGKRKFDYILLNHTLGEIEDIQDFISKIKKITHKDTRIIVFYFNYLWKPLLDITQQIGLRMPYFKEPNWLSGEDIDNFFYLESFEKIKSGKRMLLPLDLPLISTFFNKYLSVLPFLSFFALTNYTVFKPTTLKKDCSVSVIIPARNEAGNMKGIFKKLPKFKKSTEIIFVEGHSKDNTYDVIRKEIQNYKGLLKARLFKQKGKGKGDAVRLGFSKAKNDLLIILDADLTVEPKELPKFYDAIINGKGDFIMGSRLIYPMERQAMRTLNVLGNKFFSIAFSYLLDQKIKDTLCGTKVLYRKDYELIKRNRNYFGDFDPFGDYDLIFGASKLNLKITEIPIRYKERTYGTTNISRFTHGFLLLKMVFFAAKKLKFT